MFHVVKTKSWFPSDSLRNGNSDTLWLTGIELTVCLTANRLNSWGNMKIISLLFNCSQQRDRLHMSVPDWLDSPSPLPLQLPLQTITNWSSYRNQHEALMTPLKAHLSAATVDEFKPGNPVRLFGRKRRKRKRRRTNRAALASELAESDLTVRYENSTICSFFSLQFITTLKFSISQQSHVVPVTLQSLSSTSVRWKHRRKYNSALNSQQTTERLSCRAADSAVSRRVDHSGRRQRRSNRRLLQTWFNRLHWQSPDEQRESEQPADHRHAAARCPSFLSVSFVVLVILRVSF